MSRSKARWFLAVFLALAVLVSSCQGAAPTPEPKATSAPQKSSAPQASPEKTAPPEKKAESAAPAPKAEVKPAAVPASLPKATEEYLAKLKQNASAMAGLDEELKVPQEWIDGAKKEGKLSILHTIDPPQAVVLLKPFKERYPYIQVDYNRGAHEEKMKALVAVEAGRPTTDIIIGVGGLFFMMKEAGMNADLRSMPTWNTVPEGFKDPNGLWVGTHLRHWSMAFNKNKVKEQDMPKTWDELLTNPIWRNGNLALGNRPQLWMLQLWRNKGEQWAKDYLTKMFTEVKPQLRKEGMNAMIDLLGAGEYYATVPSAEYRTYQAVLEGAPVLWWSPEPIPLATSELTVLKKATNPYSARIFSNWLLSKEGQVAQYVSDFAPPVHKDMRDPAWLPFADKIVGRPTALRYPEDEETIQPKLLEFWEQLWLKGGGTAR